MGAHGTSRRRWIIAVSGIATALLLGAVPLVSAQPVATGAVTVVGAAPASGTLTAAWVTWQGTNISQASSGSHAFSITTNEVILAEFYYREPSSGGANITTARMQALYFGAVISTDQQSTSHLTVGLTVEGKSIMNWTLGTFTYLLAGAYELTASLVDSKGGTVWSENFFINAAPPYRIASGLIVFLLVLGIVELWSIATVGRSLRPPPPTPSKPSGPPEPWEPGAAPAAPESPAGEAPPPLPPPAPGDAGAEEGA